MLLNCTMTNIIEKTIPVKVIMPPEIVESNVSEVSGLNMRAGTPAYISHAGKTAAMTKATEIYTAGIPHIRDCGRMCTGKNEKRDLFFI